MATDAIMSTEASMAAVGAWTAVWLAVHCIAARPAQGPYERRSRRGQLFAALAALAAARLLAAGERWPQDLLSGASFTLEHQLVFSMAAGHWLVSLFEDLRCKDVLARSLEKRALGHVPDPASYVLRLHVVHHVVFAGCYLALLTLRTCAVVGTFCLLFELPALMMHRRDLALRRSPVPQWLRSRELLQRHWRRCYGLYTLGRGLPALVYVYGVLQCRRELGELSPAEAVVVHGFSVFACVFNVLYLDVLRAASRFDLDAAAREAVAGVEASGSDSDSAEDAAQASPVNPEAAPLREVTLDELAANAGAAPGSPVWLAIDGTAYDITGFLVGCPCGEQVLRKWAGKDATEAFSGVVHSPFAKEQMLRYMVGPLRYPHTEYRFMEHEEEERPVHGLVVAVAASFALKLLADSCVLSASATLPGGAEEQGYTELALVALLATAGMGGASFCARLLARPARASALPASPLVAVGVVLFNIGFLISCRSLPRGLPAAAPAALELAAGLLLLGEELLAGLPAGGDKLLGFWGAALAVLLSWFFRAEPADVTVDAARSRFQRAWHRVAHVLSFYGDHGSLALLLALAVLVTMRQVHRQRAAPRDFRLRGDWTAAAAAGVLQLSGVCGAVGAALLASWDPAASDRALALLTADASRTGVLMTVASISSTLLASALLAMAAWCSPSFASRAAAFGLALGGLLLSGLAGLSWLTLAGFLAHLTGLASRNRSRLRDAGTYGRFADIPSHVVGAQGVWDRFRTWLGSSIWSITVLQYRELINAWLPRELRVFAVDAPFPNLGGRYDRTYMGVCAHFAPKKALGRQKMPNYCVCNVGQIHTAALADMQMTMNTLIDVWSEFQDPKMKGLLSNLVAVFPDVEEQRVAKEINLSFWESSRYAHNWYVRSPGHKNAVFQHTAGRLHTFGNLLASLEMAGAPQHRDRCRQCSRPVYAKEPGAMAPPRCGVCGGAAFRHPLF